MKKILLACVLAASLGGCSWWDRDHGRDNYSGATTPPPQSQSNTAAPQSQSAPSAQSEDWSKCDEHPYTPGPKTCK